MGRRQERTGRRPAPLPIRDGLNPSRVRLPESGTWLTTLDYLLARFHVERERLLEKVSAREVVDEDGVPVDDVMPFRANSFVYLYRDPADEPRVPFEVDVLFRDEHLLVADKPHFLSSLPNGSYIVESAVVRLRRALDLPNLSPLHRLDRITAGVLLFSLQPRERGVYQTMFARREVRKSYRAVAGISPDLELPRSVTSRIVKDRGTPTAYETEGEHNSETRIELLESRGDRGLYRLEPSTGKTHQLRVHLNSLGIPIVNDPFYPRLLDVPHDDYSRPLQLLAAEIAFTDPVTGQERDFASRRRLECWPEAGLPDHGGSRDEGRPLSRPSGEVEVLGQPD
jgi:tRNA pseudouridine32 synthase/23S rRNA pseudouridine746 synthase